ncbi:MAG: YHS domain-containing protein [Planctomycetota bacterium]|jgi:YHS domain-containing protein
MNTKKKHLVTLSLVVGLLLVGLIVVDGCKKSEPEPAEPAAPTLGKVAEEAVSQAMATIEQTNCPVMGAPINKALFVEHKGKKVYFCCPGCEEKFKESPEKYIAKLPQFQQ